MTTSILIDSNIFIDVFGPENAFTEWSIRMLKKARREASLVLSPVVWAELAAMAPREEELLMLVSRLGLVREPLSFAAAHRAGRAHADYRRRGGARERTLPDFLIGAHAAERSHSLLTRDAGRYRSYFPDLDLITPETHP
ncbi:type II toxin-antitoxin system VapC family toxin [Rhizobium sp. PAMB 3182]